MAAGADVPDVPDTPEAAGTPAKQLVFVPAPDTLSKAWRSARLDRGKDEADADPVAADGASPETPAKPHRVKFGRTCRAKSYAASWKDLRTMENPAPGPENERVPDRSIFCRKEGMPVVIKKA